MRKKTNLGSVADWIAIIIALATFVAERMANMPDWFVYIMGALLLIALIAAVRIVLRVLRSGESTTEDSPSIAAQGDGSVAIVGQDVNVDHGVVGPGGTAMHIEIHVPPSPAPAPPPTPTPDPRPTPTPAPTLPPRPQPTPTFAGVVLPDGKRLPPPPRFTLSYLGWLGPDRLPVGVFRDGEEVVAVPRGEVIAKVFILRAVGPTDATIGFVGYPETVLAKVQISR